MKKIKKYWIGLLFVIIISASLFSFFVNPQNQSRDAVHPKDLEASTSALSTITTFELVFSRFLIEYWEKNVKFPTPNEVCDYIASLDFKTLKDSYRGMMKPGGALFLRKGYELFNNSNEVLIVQYQIVDSKALFNIPQDKIGVVFYFSLNEIIKTANGFPKSKYPDLPDDSQQTQQRLKLLEYHLKWLPADNVEKLVLLFNNDHSRFKDSWAQNTSLLNFDSLQNNLKNYFSPKDIERTIFFDKFSLLSSFNFLLEYVLKNQTQILAFSKRLEDETANTVKPVAVKPVVEHKNSFGN